MRGGVIQPHDEAGTAGIMVGMAVCEIATHPCLLS
jgi:hypothetical protein